MGSVPRPSDPRLSPVSDVIRVVVFLVNPGSHAKRGRQEKPAPFFVMPIAFYQLPRGRIPGGPYIGRSGATRPTIAGMCGWIWQ
jgi:hypothetical protein